MISTTVHETVKILNINIDVFNVNYMRQAVIDCFSMINYALYCIFM